MGGNRCVVQGCSSSNKSEVSFHRIPWNKHEVRRRWIENIVVMGKTPIHVINRESRVCSLHFTERSSKKTKEVPTVFAGIRKAPLMDVHVSQGNLVNEEVHAHFSKLCSQLNEMRVKRELCDLRIQVRDCDIAVHRCVMAAFSPHIRRLLDENVQVLKFDKLSSDGLMHSINFLYTGKIDLSALNITSVLAVAKLLQISELKRKCDKFLNDFMKKQITQTPLKPSVNAGHFQMSPTSQSIQTTQAMSPSKVHMPTPVSVQNISAANVNGQKCQSGLLHRINANNTSTALIQRTPGVYEEVRDESGVPQGYWKNCDSTGEDEREDEMGGTDEDNDSLLDHIAADQFSYRSESEVDDDDDEDYIPCEKRRKTGNESLKKPQGAPANRSKEQPAPITAITEQKWESVVVADSSLSQCIVTLTRTDIPVAKSLRTLGESSDLTRSAKSRTQEEMAIQSMINNAAVVKCKKCDATFAGIRELNAHNRQMHTKVKPFSINAKCEYCHRQFSNSWTYERHLEEHWQARNSYRCPYCDAPFSTKEEADTHVDSKHPNADASQIYSCGQCSMYFGCDFRIFARHMRSIHNNSKPFACTQEDCVYTTNRPHFLEGHKEQYHPELVDKGYAETSFSCQHCKQNFSDALSLQEHVVTCQPVPLVKVKVEPVDAHYGTGEEVSTSESEIHASSSNADNHSYSNDMSDTLSLPSLDNSSSVQCKSEPMFTYEEAGICVYKAENYS